MDKENNEDIIEDDFQMSNFSQIISMIFVTVVMVFLYVIIIFF